MAREQKLKGEGEMGDGVVTEKEKKKEKEILMGVVHENGV